MLSFLFVSNFSFFFVATPSFRFASVFYNRLPPYFLSSPIQLPFLLLFPSHVFSPIFLVSLFHHTEKARAERECFIGTRRQLQTTPILEKKAQRKL